MSFHAVIEGGKPVLIIRGNDVVGKGIVKLLSPTTGCCAIALIDEKSKVIVRDTDWYKIFQKDDCIMLRYVSDTGAFYASGQHGPDDEKLKSMFGDTCVVDELQFYLGHCPDSFKTVAGYGSAWVEASGDHTY